jgi:hypothetical protein
VAVSAGRAARLAVEAARLKRTVRTIAEATASPWTTVAKVAWRAARRHPWIAAVVALLSCIPLFLAAMTAYIVFTSVSDAANAALTAVAVAFGAEGEQNAGYGSVGCLADRGKMAEATGIPELALSSYCLAAGRVGVDWAILAGIGHRECDHGRSRMAGCNPDIPSAVDPSVPEVNERGARGPMQFLGSTWDSSKDAFDPDVAGPPIPEGQEHRGYASDGDGDGVADPWSFPDAAVAAARLLKNNGVDADVRRALHTYNPSWSYVDDVLESAERYRADVAPLLPVVPGEGYTGPKGSTALYSEPGLPQTTRRMLDEVIPRFGRGYGVGCQRNEPGSDHHVGLACDFMMATPANTLPTPEMQAHGSAMANYLIANADRLRVKYIIWWKQIWQNGQWRPYTRYDPGGSLTQNHYDHVHVSLYAS